MKPGIINQIKQDYVIPTINWLLYIEETTSPFSMMYLNIKENKKMNLKSDIQDEI